MRAFALVFASQLTFGQQWTQLPDFPGTKRDDGTGCVVNNKAYFGTGLQEGWSSTTDWYQLDLSSYTWSTIPSMPSGKERQYACAFPGADGFFVFGGDNYGGLTDVLFYNVNTSTWTSKTPKPGKGLIGATCLAFSDKIYIAGGKVNGDSLPSKEVWVYSISGDSWQRKADMPFQARWRAGGCVLGAAGYMGGGFGNDKKPMKDFYMFDPSADLWYPLDSLPCPLPLGYASIQAVGNKLVFFGGQDTNAVYNNKCWYYRIIQQEWVSGPNLPSHGRRGGMSIGAGEKYIYTCGLGPQDQRLNTTWLLDLPLPVEEVSAERLHVAPNPFSEALTLRTAIGSVITLQNASGVTVLQTAVDTSYTRISTETLPAGLYFARIITPDGKTSIHRLIKRD